MKINKLTYLKLAIFFLISTAYLLSVYKITQIGEGHFSLLTIIASISILALLFSHYTSIFGVLIISLASVYSAIYLSVFKNMGFPLDSVIVESLSILMDTNIDEASSFFENITVRQLFPLIGLLSIFFLFSPLSCKNKKINIIIPFISVPLMIYFISYNGLAIKKSVQSLIESIALIKENKSSIENIKKFTWNARTDSKGKRTVVIILGETTRGDHFGINGYNRDTTPLLKNQNLINFTNTISNGSHTLSSTPLILTRKILTQDNLNELWPEKSLISAYKEAGYKTFYISYMPKIQKGDGAINQIVNEADHYIQRDKGSTFAATKDEIGIDIIDNIIKNDNSEKKLIIYKLVGSHFNFQYRYPDNFEIFKPSYTSIEYKSPTLKDKEILTNTYDNSIVYTDYVVSSIIDNLKKIDGDVTLSFISDHGIAILEDNESVYYGKKRIKANYSIPLFFWLNDIATNRLGDKINNLKKHTSEHIDGSYFLDTQLTLSDIYTPKVKNRNLFDDHIGNHIMNVEAGSKVIDYNSLEF